jgi:hypothetical protein
MSCAATSNKILIDDRVWAEKNISYHINHLSAPFVMEYASYLLQHNQGMKRPFKVALDQLLLTIKGVAACEYDYKLDAKFTGTIRRDEYIARIIEDTLDIIQRTPEILCTLCMCDLNIPFARQLALSLKGTLSNKQRKKPSVRFEDLTYSFAKRTIEQKRSDDPFDNYWVFVTFTNTKGEQQKKKIYFANPIVFLAYKYFCHFVWADTEGVPSSWLDNRNEQLLKWIEYTTKNKDRRTPFIEFVSAIPRALDRPVVSKIIFGIDTSNVEKKANRKTRRSNTDEKSDKSTK